ncbi:hypothetical protein BKA66DRAFT_445764 [Pyrenochaeta sp. MPI-SDFR-AT-0127]|nr:hypothetical protein BKA66DRAFT_445764 [Pyrenochaeta sp. MPI-SDFR-AT-0127]
MKFTGLVALVAALSGVAQAGVSVVDSATPSGCTGATCCIPSCTIRVQNVAGCNRNEAFANACISQQGLPSVTRTWGNCKLVYNPPNSSGVGSAVIYSPQAPNGISYTFWKCKRVDQGGKQCAPVGGGCSVVGG